MDKEEQIKTLKAELFDLQVLAGGIKVEMTNKLKELNALEKSKGGVDDASNKGTIG